MKEESVEALAAVEYITDKTEKKRRPYNRVVLAFAVGVILLVLLMKLTGKQDGVTPLENKTEKTTTSSVILEKKGPLSTPEGFSLAEVNDRQAPFQAGSTLFRVDAQEMVFSKEGRKYSVYLSQGTPAGWKKIIGTSGVTVEENLSDSVYSADYTYGVYSENYSYSEEQITFIFWWHNDSMIGVNGTQRTEELIDLTRRLISAYPPTEKLI